MFYPLSRIWSPAMYQGAPMLPLSPRRLLVRSGGFHIRVGPNHFSQDRMDLRLASSVEGPGQWRPEPRVSS